MSAVSHASLAPLHRAAEALWPTLDGLLADHPSPAMAGFTVEVLPTLDSTNAELMRRVRTASPAQRAPTLLVTAEQTAGKGRMGKTWVSQPGDSLTFSLLLPLRPVHWAGLSLAVGVSLADTLAGLLPAEVAGDLRLKWPNDLWLRGGKLAGVLVEMAHQGTDAHVVVGVGINIRPPTLPPDAGASAGVPPTGLGVFQDNLDGGAVLQAVAPALLRDLLAFEALGFSAFAQRFEQRDALRDRALVLSDGTQGQGCGVDAQGALLVLTAGGMRAVHSADVSVRPQP